MPFQLAARGGESKREKRVRSSSCIEYNRLLRMMLSAIEPKENMIRAIFLAIVAVLYFDNAELFAAIQKEIPPPETQAQLVKLWNAAAENMKLSSSFFAAKATNGICKVDTEVRPREFTPRSPQILIVKGSFVAP
ncbi:MAG: hypothetical protein WC429_06540, partial [Verrucomicrobiia bacterium]